MLNMIETVFLISLAITFVLILLMVYHFNQRVAALETSSNSMIELVHSFADQQASCGAFKNSAKCPAIPEENEYTEDDVDGCADDGADNEGADADADELSYSSDDDENQLDVDDDVSIKKISIPNMVNMLPIPMEFANMFIHNNIHSQYVNETDDDEDAYMDMPELEDMKDIAIVITDELPVMDTIPVQNDEKSVVMSGFVDTDKNTDNDTDTGVCLDADAEGCFDAADFTDTRNLDGDIADIDTDADPDPDHEDDDGTPQTFNESVPLNYQKQSVHQLRMIVVSRGLNANIDVNKLKKNELIRILSA